MLGKAFGLAACTTGVLGLSFYDAKAPPVPATAVPSMQLEKEVNTGDVVMYQSDTSMHRTGLLKAQIILTKIFSRSAWDHMGIVVNVADDGTILPPRSKAATAPGQLGRPMVMEATVKGVKLFPFRERVQSYRADKVAVRFLTVENPHGMGRALEAFIEEVKQKPYTTNYLDLVMAALRTAPEDIKAAKIKILERTRNQAPSSDSGIFSLASLNTSVKATDHSLSLLTLRSPHADSLERLKSSTVAGERKFQSGAIFCSEMVAGAFQQMGVLPREFPKAHKYIPKDFISGDSLRGLNGASLGPEVFVADTKGRRRMEQAHRSLLSKGMQATGLALLE